MGNFSVPFLPHALHQVLELMWLLSSRAEPGMEGKGVAHMFL